MNRTMTVGYALVALALLGNFSELAAFGALQRFRSRHCCPPPCAPTYACAPRGTICTKWYFCQMGNLHLHYGGDPGINCNPATTQMYLNNRWCSPSGCPCPGTSGTNTYCETNFRKHEDNALDPDSTKELDFEVFELELALKGTYLMEKWKVPASDGTPCYMRVYKVTLSAEWQARLGYVPGVSSGEKTRQVVYRPSGPLA